MLTNSSINRVVYFNLGAHHIPTSSDLPNTLAHTSATSMQFMPFNYFDRDVSRSSVSGVKIPLNTKDRKPQYFGGRYEEGFTLNKEHVDPDLTTYGGLPGVEFSQTKVAGQGVAEGGLAPGVGAEGQAALGQGLVQLTFNNTLMGMGIIPN